MHASALELIGNTPLVPLHRFVPEGDARVLVKLESKNPTGSMQDRAACPAIAAQLKAKALSDNNAFEALLELLDEALTNSEALEDGKAVLEESPCRLPSSPVKREKKGARVTK